MSGFAQFWTQGDLITRSVAALLLLMSVSAWAITSPILSAVPEGASTLCRWCASITSMS